jgi:hypothetical protein
VSVAEALNDYGNTNAQNSAAHLAHFLRWTCPSYSRHSRLPKTVDYEDFSATAHTHVAKLAQMVINAIPVDRGVLDWFKALSWIADHQISFVSIWIVMLWTMALVGHLFPSCPLLESLVIFQSILIFPFSI